MILTAVAFGVLLVSLIGLLTIILRKFPTLASIATGATAAAMAERKSSLLEQRLKRKFQSVFGFFKTRSVPAMGKTKALWTRTQKKLVDLEHEYKVRSLPVFLNRRQRHKIDSEILDILNQAKALIDDGEQAAAEEKILQAIRLEPRSVPAFELLGELYLAMKEFGHAKEVFQFLLKLTGESDAIYEHMAEADMGEGHLDEARSEFQKAVDLNPKITAYHFDLARVYHQLEQWPKAFASIAEALRLEPNSPKILDEYIDISLGYGKKDFAASAIAKMKEVNPENSKIADWEARLQAVPKTHVHSSDDQAA